TDRVAYDALLEAHAATGDWDALYDELERGLARVGEGEERTALVLRMAEVATTSGKAERAITHYRELVARDTSLPEPLREAAGRPAEEHGSSELYRDVLLRRVASATDPQDEVQCLERLGALQATRLGDGAAAAESWRRAARLAEGTAADPDR